MLVSAQLFCLSLSSCLSNRRRTDRLGWKPTGASSFKPRCSTADRKREMEVVREKRRREHNGDRPLSHPMTRAAVYNEEVHARERHSDDACFWPMKGSLDAVCWSCAATMLRGAPRAVGPGDALVSPTISCSKREFAAKVRLCPRSRMSRGIGMNVCKCVPGIEVAHM